MNNLALKWHVYEQFGSVRTITKDDQPWFIGMDIARALGYKNPRDAVNKKVWKQNKDICKLYVQAQKQADEFVCILETKSERGNPNTTIINEAGVYQLIFGSKLESAKAFQNWVVHGGEHKTVLKIIAKKRNLSASSTYK